MNRAVIAMVILKETMPKDKFLEYIDYKHPYFQDKDVKETIPVVITMNLDNIKKDGIVNFSVNEWKNGVVTMVGSKKEVINSFSYDEAKKLCEKQAVLDDDTPVTIANLKKIKDLDEAMSYLDSLQGKLPNCVVHFFGHCDAPNECIVGSVDGVCKKCDLFKDAKYHAIGKEAVKV